MLEYICDGSNNIILMYAAVQNNKKNKITLCRHRQSRTQTKIIITVTMIRRRRIRKNSKIVGKRQSYVALSM